LIALNSFHRALIRAACDVRDETISVWKSVGRIPDIFAKPVGRILGVEIA
jgi:hypothetical protein